MKSKKPSKNQRKTPELYCEKLEPCPFCGNKELEFIVGPFTGGNIYCPKCNTHGPSLNKVSEKYYSWDYDDKEEMLRKIVEAWNTRHKEKADAES